jgi:hypothetical protein
MTIGGLEVQTRLVLRAWLTVTLGRGQNNRTVAHCRGRFTGNKPVHSLFQMGDWW